MLIHEHRGLKMKIDSHDSLLEYDDGLDVDSGLLVDMFPGDLDARRRIECYRELKQLRHFLDDPEFDYDFN